jgi:hypothetical protein
MKLTTFVRLSILIGTAGLCSYGLAGPASSSGPAQPDSGLGGVMAPAVQLPSGVSPGFAARDSVASQSTAGTQSTAANASANGSSGSADGSSNASATGQNPSANPYSNGFLNQNTTAASNVIGRGQEKVVEISAKDLAAEAAEKTEKSEVTKKFEPSILNSGIDEIAKPGTISKVTDSGAQNPVTGAALQSAASEGARSSQQNSTDPATNAATSPRP